MYGLHPFAFLAKVQKIQVLLLVIDLGGSVLIMRIMIVQSTLRVIEAKCPLHVADKDCGIKNGLGLDWHL